MGKTSVYHHALNVGVNDKGTLPRVDLERMRLAAEEQTNLMCLATGRGFMRPGMEWLGVAGSAGKSRIKEFIFGATDACIFELTNNAMRFWVNDALVARVPVSSNVADGGFDTGAGWTLAPTAGATAVIAGGALTLNAIGKGSAALAKQVVATSSPGVEHALRVVVGRGPVVLRCGSFDGADDYIEETQLRTGVHSLAFTPLGSYWVQLTSESPVARRVDSINVEGAGVVSLPTVWTEADLPLIRFSQSADVVFSACRGRNMQRIERRGVRGLGRSWSVVLYQADDGPFTVGRTAQVRLKPNAVLGNAMLNADRPFFRDGHVGSLFKAFHTGQLINARLSGEGQYTDPIEVTGINSSETNDRYWTWEVSGVWAGALRVLRSFDGPDFGYHEYRADKDVPGTVTITSNSSGENDDKDDNATVWYRIGFEDGAYTSGTADVAIRYSGGGGSGVCRILTVISSTSAEIEILSSFKGLSRTDDWQEGQWSGLRGYPSAVALFEGRLWWSNRDRVWGSISDDFESFDEDVEGDSGPINRVVATGGVNETQWMMPLQRLLFGTEGTETSARSSSFDEPLTPTNTTLKDASTIGSAPIDPVRVDGGGLFVDRSGQSIFELKIDADSADYSSGELNKLTKDLFGAGLAGLVVQRRPDTRIWAWLDDGRSMCIVYEPKQEVVAFIPLETDGAVESIVVLPAAAQDRVYFMVNRTVDGGEVRYFEKLALDSESKPGPLAKVMDSFKVFTNSPASAIIGGLMHLVGKTVVVWADGAPVTQMVDGNIARMEFVVSPLGEITLPAPAWQGVAGLSYRWRYKSSRLAYGASGGTAMLQKKRIDELGIIMTDFARAGVRYGRQFDNPLHPTSRLPQLSGGKSAPAIVISDVHDEEPFVFPGDWDTDSRVCIEGQSPFPATILGLVFSITTNG